MASHCPPQPACPALQPLPSFWAPRQEWGWPPRQSPQERSRGSPASSPEWRSGSLSPAAAAAAAPRASGPRAKGGRRGRLADGQRQSASQREKLRMRRLAGALHTLRRFLPPALAPAGRSLTKVETLRLASRYIGHLSQLLGLGRQRPGRRCPLCPPPEPPAPQAWPWPDAADAAWAPGPSTDAADGTHAEDRAGRGAAGAEPSRGDPCAQSLPAELLAWLEDFLSPPAQD